MRARIRIPPEIKRDVFAYGQALRRIDIAQQRYRIAILRIIQRSVQSRVPHVPDSSFPIVDYLEGTVFALLRTISLSAVRLDVA